LQSAKGLVLPKEIGGGLYLHSLQSADGLVLPKEIGGYLDLYSLQSAKGLVLPKKIVSHFVGVLEAAGVKPLSLEVEPQAVARALISRGDSRTTLIINFNLDNFLP